MRKSNDRLKATFCCGKTFKRVAAITNGDTMERLSFIDQVLHKIGSSGLPPLYMQGAMVIDPAKTSYKITPAILASHIAERLSEFPILHKKLVQDRFRIGDMRLVDDPKFNPLYHIDFATLAAPGDNAALYAHIAKFSVKRLDFRHAPWRFEIIDGLEGGKLAIVQKLSHATMDGMMAFKIMQSLFDEQPVAPSSYTKHNWQFEPELDERGLINEALIENWHRYGIKAPKLIWSLSREGVAALRQRKTRSISKTTHKRLKARPTSVNGAISLDKRSLGVATFPVDKLKEIAKKLDVTVNDLSLVMTSEALCHYFEKTGEQLHFDLIFVMPMSTRSDEDKRAGNALSLATISAHNTLVSLDKRLQAISKDTREAKAKRSTIGEHFIEMSQLLSPLVIDALTLLLKKLSPWRAVPTLANAVVTNLPGPAEAVYFAGMPIEYQLPIIPVFHKAALSIGATSMANSFSIGIHACGDAVKQENMHLLTDALYATYNDLDELASKKAASKSRPSAGVSAINSRRKQAAKPTQKML